MNEMIGSTVREVNHYNAELYLIRTNPTQASKGFDVRVEVLESGGTGAESSTKMRARPHVETLA